MEKPRSTRYFAATAALAFVFAEAPVFARDAGTSVKSEASDSPAQEADQLEGAEAGALALLDVPLEDLLTLESTSVAKKRQKVAESAAAVYVVTQETISRSSASTIPDLLRLVPGVEVAQLTNGSSAVTIRGFNSKIANSLLVMVDGRSIYNSAASGVFWDQLLLPFADIERIEVVRGPGASLWGANAVNGVINIITKHSSDTLDATATGRAGSRSQEASFTYGSRLSDTLSFRTYGVYRHDNGLLDANGGELSRRWQGLSVGTRMDWQPTIDDAVTLSADYGKGDFDTPFLELRRSPLNPGYDPIAAEGGFKSYNVLGRWTHQQNEKLDWSLQVYHSYLNRREVGFAGVRSKVLDADLGVHWVPNATHDIAVGLGARQLDDESTSTPSVTLTRLANTDRWLSGYVQDDISLIEDKLRLTIGAKLEKNDFTGFEFQPSARVFLKVGKGLALWGAVSRAVRTPSLLERVTQISLTALLPGAPENPLPLPVYPRLNGVPDKKSEILLSYEAGFRADLAEGWSLDVAGYYNDYSRLLALAPTGFQPILSPSIAQPVGLYADFDLGGAADARTWGFEALLKGQIASGWRMEASYSHLNYEVGPDPLSGAPYELVFPLQGSPRHQLGLRSYADLSDNVLLDTQLRHVSELYHGQVPAYTALDARLTYRPRVGLEMSLIGEGLLDDQRLEFIQNLYPTPPSYVPRTVAAEVRLQF
ncbi:TonB-dependent receptor [Novosphingobium sp. RD2P27]|uniref:TonB-dependent receptor n=1 Tax=Novosphingobium kalidii TaxID=3230299 RepID=A0ABV2D3B9_9SPHN